MELDILMMNVRTWENLELSTMQTSLIRTTEAIPYLGKGFIKKDNHTIINNMVDELRMIESKKVSVVNHEES